MIGDKVVEINTESPGGLQALERSYDIDICPVVINALDAGLRIDFGCGGLFETMRSWACHGL